MDKLLLVDDVPANLKILIEALEDSYEIIIATNGERALRWAASSDQRPDLILLDIMMPGMDGHEVCRRLQADPATRDIPVIFVTAMHEEADETKGLALGAVDYVHKPYSLAIIRARIASQLALKKQRDQLAQAQTQLQIANERLEIRVAERTSELQESNSRLVEEVYQHKKTARDLEKARDAAGQASRAKREFMDNMSHEIRTPINGIMGFTNLLADSKLTGRQQDHVEKITASSQRLLTTVDKILDFTKIEAEELELKGQVFSLGQLVSTALAGVAQLVAAKELTLESELDPQLPEQLAGDPERIQQVLLNLLDNAIKFSHQGGRVKLLVHQQAVMERGVVVHFQVMDQGIGIPADKQGLIFGAFDQADASNSRRYEGTGLGLTISALLVEMMGGRIWLESDAEQGTTFHVTVALERAGESEEQEVWQPAAPEGERAATSAGQAGGESKPSPPHILLAEDEEINRQLLEELLLDQGWQVTAVADGQAAVAAHEQQAIDLILMDIQMPLLSGHEATMAIRKLEAEKGGHVPIIAVTAHALPGDRERCLAVGMDDYIAKPVKTRELLAKVEERLVAL
ncbi:MAG: response regulator [Thermodesulfobacteriota bacterium]